MTDTTLEVLEEVLGHFSENGHPGVASVRTPWLDDELVQRWRDHVAAARQAERDLRTGPLATREHVPGCSGTHTLNGQCWR